MMSQTVNAGLQDNRRPLPPTPIPVMVPKPVGTRRSDFSNIIHGTWQVPAEPAPKQVNSEMVELNYVRSWYRTVVCDAHRQYARPNTPPSPSTMPNPHPRVPIERRGHEPATQFFYPTVLTGEDAAIPKPQDISQETRAGANLVRRHHIKGNHLRSHTCSNITTTPALDSTWVIIPHPREKPLPSVPPISKHTRCTSFDNYEQTKRVRWLVDVARPDN